MNKERGREETTVRECDENKAVTRLPHTWIRIQAFIKAMPAQQILASNFHFHYYYVCVISGCMKHVSAKQLRLKNFHRTSYEFSYLLNLTFTFLQYLAVIRFFIVQRFVQFHFQFYIHLFEDKNILLKLKKRS